jgi:hypothetical protein
MSHSAIDTPLPKAERILHPASKLAQPGLLPYLFASLFGGRAVSVARLTRFKMFTTAFASLCKGAFTNMFMSKS